MHPGWADTPAVRTSLPQFYEMVSVGGTVHVPFPYLRLLLFFHLVAVILCYKGYVHAQGGGASWCSGQHTRLTTESLGLIPGWSVKKIWAFF